MLKDEEKKNKRLSVLSGYSMLKDEEEKKDKQASAPLPYFEPVLPESAVQTSTPAAPEKVVGAFTLADIANTGKAIISAPFRKESRQAFEEGFTEGTLGASSAVARAGSSIARRTGLEGAADYLGRYADEDMAKMRAINETSPFAVSDQRSFSESIRDPNFIARGVGQALPNLLAALGIAAPAAAAGAPALITGGIAFGTTALLEGGSAINEAEEFGVKDQDTKDKIGAIVGVANGILESLPIANIVFRSPAGKQAKGRIISEIARRVAKQAALEGGTESIQQIVSNSAAKVYDEDRDLFKGVPESAFFGALLGGGISAPADITQLVFKDVKEAGLAGQRGFAINPFVPEGLRPLAEKASAAGSAESFMSGITPKELREFLNETQQAGSVPKTASESATGARTRKEGDYLYEQDREYFDAALADIHEGRNADSGIVKDIMDFYERAVSPNPAGASLQDIAAGAAPPEIDIDSLPAPKVADSAGKASTKTRFQKQVEQAVAPKAPKKEVRISEKAELKKKLAGLEKASKQGKRLGIREARESITAQLRESFSSMAQSRIASASNRAATAMTRTAPTGVKGVRAKKPDQDLIDLRKRIMDREMQRAKADITEYAKNLPLSERGKLIASVKNAKDQRDVVRAFSRIDRKIQEIEKKDMVASIRKAVDRINDSPSVAVDYKERVSSLLDGISIEAGPKDFQQKLRKLQDFVDAEKAAGRNVLLPERLLKSLKNLGKTSISDMSVTELSSILFDIEMLEQIGRAKVRTIGNLYDMEKEYRKQEAMKDLVSLEKSEYVKAKPGESLSISERFRNAFSAAKNAAQRIDLAITPMDVVFDMLSGSKGTYDSGISKVFKGSVDRAYQNYLTRKDIIADRIVDLADSLGLETKNYERIGVHAARMQEGGREKLYNTGLTDEDIDSIVLTESESELYEAMRKELDDLREPIANMMRLLYNKGLDRVANYFSFMTDFEAMSDLEVWDRIGNTDADFGMPKKNAEQGFTKKRTGAGKQKIRIDAMSVFLKHVDQASYLVEMGRETKMLGEIAASPEFLEKAGDLGTKIVREWVDLVARQGGKAGAEKIAVLDALRRNLGVAALGFKLSSAIVQPTALMDAASVIGRHAFTGAVEIASSRDARRFVYENMPELRERTGDDPAFLEMSRNSTFRKLQDSGYWVLKELDKLTAYSTAYGAYLKKLGELGIEFDAGKPNKEAIEYAQLVTRRTQSSSLFKDAPMAVTKGALTGSRSFDKALLQFQTFMLTRWSRLRHDAFRAGIMKGRYERFASQALWLAIAVMAEYGLRKSAAELVSFLTGKEEDDEQTFTEGTARGILSTVPFLGTIMGMATYGSSPVPALEAIGSVSEGAKKVIDAKKAETKAKGAIDATAAASTLFGIPGSIQAKQLLKDLIDAESEKPDTASGGNKRSAVRPNVGDSGSRRSAVRPRKKDD